MSELFPALVIVGADVTGIACTPTAARQKKAVPLLEKSAQLGGMVTDTLGGFFNDRSDVLNLGLSAEFVEEGLITAHFGKA